MCGKDRHPFPLLELVGHYFVWHIRVLGIRYKKISQTSPTRLRVRGRRGWGRGWVLLHAPSVFACERVSGSQPRCRMPPRVMQPPTRLCASREVSGPRAGCQMSPHVCVRGGVVVAAGLPHAFASERGVRVSGCQRVGWRLTGRCRIRTLRICEREGWGGVVARLSHAPPTCLPARGVSGGVRGESRVEHLTVLATPPVFRAPAVWGTISRPRARRSRYRSRAWSGPCARPIGLHKSD